MRTTDEMMFERTEVDDVRARILVIHFHGALDAGGAGRLATQEMLRSLPSERIATFDADHFLDYRSHRPVSTVENWVMTSLEVPEIALDRVRDDLGNPILVLHGPEPDAKWEAFSRIVAALAQEAGVEITVSFHGIPSGVPHTRATPVHVQATDASLVPVQPKMAQVLQFPTPASAFLQSRLHGRGMNGIAMLAAVPFYMADTGYPAGASALLGALSEYADLSLPVGELEQGAAEDQETIASLIEANTEILHTVSALEEHYDAWTSVGSGMPVGALGQDADMMNMPKESKDIGEVIEAYLANLASQEGERQGEDSQEATCEHTEDEDPLAAALRRVEERRKFPDGVRATPPLHRAVEPQERRAKGVDTAGPFLNAPLSLDDEGGSAEETQG